MFSCKPVWQHEQFPENRNNIFKSCKNTKWQKQTSGVFLDRDCSCLTEDGYVSGCFCSLSRLNCVLCFRFFSAVQGMISLSCSQNNDRKPQDRDLRKSRAAQLNSMQCHLIFFLGENLINSVASYEMVCKGNVLKAWGRPQMNYTTKQMHTVMWFTWHFSLSQFCLDFTKQTID